MLLRIVIAFALFAAACLVYAQTADFNFVNYDDPELYENPHLQEGLSAPGVRWAFTTYHVANYIPVTVLTYLADYEASGLDAGAFHVTNLLFHAANSALLFIVLYALTGRVWPSALVAGLFALHPLHVESVAWISERKDVVSTFFGLLALWVYAFYARAPRWWSYAIVFVLLACSLLAKPMLVTFPFVCLLLDYWPLDRATVDRYNRRTWYRLFVEKIPLFILVAVFCGIVVMVQRDARALPPSEFLAWSSRVGNAIVSYVRYLGLTAFPHGLIPYYPHPQAALPPWQIVGAALVLAGITAGAWLARTRAPHFLVGWLLYAGTLVPVIGLVQVGGQAIADRYTYVPLIGIFIAVAWTLAALGERLPKARIPIAVACLLALITLGVHAHKQTARWRDSIALYEYTLSVDPKNPVALPNLGGAYLDAGRYEDAVATIERALENGQTTAGVHANLGLALRKLGRLDEAQNHLLEAVRLDPWSAQQRTSLALVLMDQGRKAPAQQELEKALSFDANYVPARVNLGNLMMSEAKFPAAEVQYRAVLDLDPRNADALSNLGALHLLRHEYKEAERRSRAALEIAPDDAITRTNLAVALMELGDGAGARREAQAALESDPAYQKAQALLNELDRRGMK